MYSNLESYLDKLSHDVANLSFKDIIARKWNLRVSSWESLASRHKNKVLRHWIETLTSEDQLTARMFDGDGWEIGVNKDFDPVNYQYKVGACQGISIEGNIILVKNRFVDDYTQKAYLRKYARLLKETYSLNALRTYVRDHQCESIANELRNECKRWKFEQENIEKRQSISYLDKARKLPLNPDSFKYDRALGIEIECYGKELGTKLPVWCREKGDGSLNAGGIEFVALVKRSELEHRLYKLCDLIKGYKVDKACGLHVHLDFRGKTISEIKVIARKLNAWLYALREFVPASRRGNQYCDFGISIRDRYKAVNVCAFNKHSTIEIRLHSGTTDYTKIISWIRLLELLLVIKTTPRGKEGVQALLDLPLCEYERAYWLKRHQVLNPALYANATPTTEVE